MPGGLGDDAVPGAIDSIPRLWFVCARAREPYVWTAITIASVAAIRKGLLIPGIIALRWIERPVSLFRSGGGKCRSRYGNLPIPDIIGTIDRFGLI